MTTIAVKDATGASQTITLTPSTITSGVTTVTTAGTAVVLGAAATLTRGVTIRGEATNASTVFVGAATVSSTVGYRLAASESVFVYTDDISTIYIDAEANGEGVSYIGS